MKWSMDSQLLALVSHNPPVWRLQACTLPLQVSRSRPVCGLDMAQKQLALVSKIRAMLESEEWLRASPLGLGTYTGPASLYRDKQIR